MVNIGDTVLVTIRSFEATLALFENNRSYLQQRLQTAGFRVLSIDDSGLSWTGSYGDLLVAVQPLTSAYALPEDIGSIVRGAAETAGYGGLGNPPELVSAQVVAVANANGQGGPQTSNEYENNLRRGLVGPGPANPNGGDDWLVWAAVGTIAAIALVSLMRR
jgi:hypothetical protein